MLPRVLPKEDFDKLVEALLAERRVAGPVAKDGKFAFAELVGPDELRMDYPITLQAPKKFFFPQYDTLLRYSLGDAVEVESVVGSAPEVVLGVHPCDLAALDLFDAVFADNEGEPTYQLRRTEAVIVGLDCNVPCDDYQFCLDMGSLHHRRGADLFLTDLGDRYFVEILTERGEALLEAAPSEARSAGSDDFAARQAIEEQKAANFHHKLPFDVKYLPEILEESYDSLIWEAVARRCFSCGSCNLVCPTCYCFDVQDEVELNLQDGRRSRRWDGCMLREFAVVATGENFRERPSERLRHRLFRKGKYILEDYGRMGCVGCGRCDRTCVAKISCVETYNQIAGSR
ncbi:MAG: 4Fe-4S dicluster domain-containing protein [Candidatus Brocadiia bacterium]